MNFQQLKIIRKAARQNYDLTEVANMLFTSWSGVSRYIQELEDKLGIEIFVQRGKRLLGMIGPDKALLVIAEYILNEASNARRLADLFTNDTFGVLTIVTTHTQARHSLSEAIKTFRELFPKVQLKLIQGTPQEIATPLQNGEADIGTASERLSNDPQFVAFPQFRWHHSLLVPLDHPLTQTTPLTLESIVKWPLITYRQGITGRSRIDDASVREGLPADIVLSVQGSDVIKTYVVFGLGIGLVVEQSSGEQEEKNSIRLDTRHLFDANIVRLGLKRRQLQHNYVWHFLELCNAGLSAGDIKRQVMKNNEEEIDYQIQQKAHYKSGLFRNLAPLTGLELMTYGLTVRRLTDRATEESLLRHILTARNILSNPIFKFPNCLPFLSTVCCICRQFVGENLCSFADSPSSFEMWFHFLQLRSALNIPSALRQVVHGTRWHSKRKSYKVLLWREITPLAASIFMENACVLLMRALNTFLVSWLGKDVMAGVGLADSFNIVIVASFAAIDLGITVAAAFSFGKRDR